MLCALSCTVDIILILDSVTCCFTISTNTLDLFTIVPWLKIYACAVNYVGIVNNNIDSLAKDTGNAILSMAIIRSMSLEMHVLFNVVQSIKHMITLYNCICKVPVWPSSGFTSSLDCLSKCLDYFQPLGI